MLGHGIVGVENLGGNLDKIPAGVEFEFLCFPLRWYMGDGSMARCVARIDEEKLNDVPERTYKYGVQAMLTLKTVVVQVLSTCRNFSQEINNCRNRVV
ncbi:MAG: hypothetical protein ACLS2X_01325 [Coprococcus sp.]